MCACIIILRTIIVRLPCESKECRRPQNAHLAIAHARQYMGLTCRRLPWEKRTRSNTIWLIQTR